MTFSGFIYEIIVTIEFYHWMGGSCAHISWMLAIIFTGTQIYVIAALLGLFILSIYGNYIVYMMGFGYALVRPFLYFDHFLYFDLLTSTCLLRPL